MNHFLTPTGKGGFRSHGIDRWRMNRVIDDDFVYGSACQQYFNVDFTRYERQLKCVFCQIPEAHPP